MQFDGMVYQQIVGIPLGTNCAPLIAYLFLYCYERDLMSVLQKSKCFDLIDMFNDTSRYLDDIFTIDNPEFEKHIPDIYPAELQSNKANTDDKETSFLDLNIKVIGSDIHTSVYDKRDDFGFPIIIFPWLSRDVPRLPSYGIYILHLVRFARCCTSVLDFHSKIYIDDVLSINNPDFENYLGQMYPPDLEMKDTTESNTSASYLDLLLSIGREGQLHTSLYDKRDDFNFHITNFPFLSSNIPSSPAYGVFISQLIRYARACSSYECFILRAMRLSNKLLGQGYVKERLKSSLRKFYGLYGDLTKQYEVPLSRMLHEILDDDHIQ